MGCCHTRQIHLVVDQSLLSRNIWVSSVRTEDSNIAVEKKKREEDMIEREQNIVLKVRKRW